MQKTDGILIATPCFGGMLTHTYVGSLINTFDWCGKERVPFAQYLLANESLITRARNRCVFEFLSSPMQKLLFIDADISWTAKDIWRLYSSSKQIIGGCYPVKTLPISLNFNPIPDHREYFPDNFKTLAQLKRYGDECASPTGEVEVEHLATGFMMIDRSVFETLRPKVSSYQLMDISLKNGKKETHHDYFSCGPYQDNFESEDWRFTRIAKEAGISSWLNVNAVLPHTGTFTFDASRYL